MRYDIEPSPTGWLVRFTVKETGRDIHYPVEAFTPDGTPLVIDERPTQLRLRPAREVAAGKGADFTDLEQSPRLVSVIPAAPGWRLRYRPGGQDMTVTVPIIAWNTYDNSETYPVPAPCPPVVQTGPVMAGRVLAPDDTETETEEETP